MPGQTQEPPDTTKVPGGDAPNPSQEVGNDLSNRDCARRVLRGVEDLEVALHVLVNVEDGGDVTAAVAVVGCRPNGHEV